MAPKTREPTGLAPWPIILIAGAEKAGKSYDCATASASDLIDRTFWLGVGEDDPDEYGAIEGARFEILLHDGTYQQMKQQLREVLELPKGDKPHLIVVDSGTRLWELFSGEAQQNANRRRKVGIDGEAQVTMDLWNQASDRWYSIIDLLRQHNGPVIITARLDVVTVLDANGKPTKEKTSKIKAQKSLPFDVGIVVEKPSRGETYITGARSLRVDVPVGVRQNLPDFTVDGLWRILGVAEASSDRQHSDANAGLSALDQTPADKARAELREWVAAARLDPNQAIEKYAAETNGDDLRTTQNADAITGMHAAWQAETETQSAVPQGQ